MGTIVDLTGRTLGIPKGGPKGKLIRPIVIEDKSPPNTTISSTYVGEKELLRVYVYIRKRKVRALIDSGLKIDLIDLRVIERLGL